MAKFFTPSKISENIKQTPEGYLLCLGVPIARTGWQEYGPGETPIEVGDDGKVQVYRDAKEVFRPQTIASFQAKSITIKHPDDFVTPENWKDLTVGVATNIRRGDEDEDGEECLLADLLITDEMAIGLVNNGLREVSCGYDAEYEETADGEGKQLNIIGNHIALVEQGRAGSSYAIRDHKGEDEMDLKELMAQLKMLGKTVDAIEKKTAAKKTKDEEKEDKEKEQSSFDGEAMMDMMKDMAEKVNSLHMKVTSGDDAEEKEEKEKKPEDDEEGSENEAEGEILSRVKALEAAVAKMLKGKAGDEEEEESEDEEKEESEDDDMSGAEDEEMDDEEGEKGEESQKKMGDAALVEILTPGKKFSGKDARAKCLKEFAKTEDGKKVLAQFGMKKPVFDSKSNVDMFFMAASSLVRAKRGSGLGGTKDSKKWKVEDLDNTASESMTPEKLNEINAAHWAKQAN